MDAFYVYALFDHAGVVRYIGKGKGSRWLQHTRDKRAPKPFIAETLALLGDLPRVKIREGLTERDAYFIEQTLISAIGRFPDGPLVNKTAKGSGPNSEQVKNWWSNVSAKERRERLQSATDASLASPVRKAMQKTLIHHAWAGLTPEHHLASARRLNASYTPEKRLKAARKRVEATTPEQRSAAGRKGIASQSAEQLSRIGRRRNEFITSEMRSEIGRKRSAHLTAEQKAENAKRLVQTTEQLRENGRRGNAKLTPEIRNAANKKRAITLGPERLREISLKAVAGRLRKKAEHAQ